MVTFFILLGCDSGAKKIAPKDIDASTDGDELLIGEDDLSSDDAVDGTSKDDHGLKDDTMVSDTDVVPETCGNSQVDEGEVCDGNLIECIDIDDNIYSAGKATCLDTCLGWDTVTCDEIPHTCGNGIVEGPEVCDTQLLTNCVEIDPAQYSAGKAYCLDDCSGYDTVTCEEITEDSDVVTDDDNTAEIDIVPDSDTVGSCGSARFDGSSGYIEVAHAALLNLTGNWTIEAWVNQDTNDALSPILRKGGATASPAYYIYGTYFQFLYTEAPRAGYYYAADTSSAVEATGPATPANGEWYHIALVKNGSTVTTFIDGVAGSAITDANNAYANSENLYFGSRQSTTPGYFDGLIDEIRISSVARYTASFTPQERFANDANTVGLWHFEETSGTIADNAAGSGLNGTLTGGVTWEDACAAEGPIVVPDDDVMPDVDVDVDVDVDTATGVIDTIGSDLEPYVGDVSRMRGNYYSCDTDSTLTEIEMYLDPAAATTVYFVVYESTTLDGTYYPLESVSRSVSAAGAEFYTSGPLTVSLQAGTYYFIGAWWGSSAAVGYAADTSATSYDTAFGAWDTGMTLESVTSAPASIDYDSTYYANNAYYQRLTTE
ncbi:MAG TPA: LamG domain-containing protein [bacterium]|nr:LamG domain-containing protein [bacterium]